MTSLAERLRDRCNADGEFRLAARYWTGTFRIDLGWDSAELTLQDGVVTAVGVPEGDLPAGLGHLGLQGPEEVWRRVLAPVPPPFHNDIVPAQAFGITQHGAGETFWQYYPAVRRAVELLRSDQ